MQLEETVEPIGDEDFMRLVQTDQGPTEVEAFCDLRLEVLDGNHQGETIEAFAFLVVRGEGHAINVTEKRTGKRLVEIPVIDTDGQPVFVTDESYTGLLPAMCEMAKIASFERFREADEDLMQRYLEKIKQHPAVKPDPVMH